MLATSPHRAFWDMFLPFAASATPRFAGFSSTDAHFVSASTDEASGLLFRYVIRADSAGVEFYIDGGSTATAWNDDVYHGLLSYKADIEGDYGGPLEWHGLNKSGTGMRARYVDDRSVRGGYRSPRSEWPRICHDMIDAMRRLERAVLPRLAQATSTICST